MNILITGTADKRPIVYPLLYCLNFLGSTAFLTNDTIFRRLLPDGTEAGTIGNTHIDTSARFVSEILQIYEFMKQDFEHFVIVSFEDCSLFEEQIRAVRDGEANGEGMGLPQQQIRIGYEAPKVKENFILLNDALFRYLYQAEINERFTPFKNSQVLNVLSTVFAPIFNKNVKDMKKLLLYKGGRIT